MQQDYDNPYSAPDAGPDLAAQQRQEEERRRREAEAARTSPTYSTGQPPPPMVRGSSVSQAWTAPAGGMEFTGGQWNENKGGLAQSDYQGMRRQLRSMGIEPDQGDSGLLQQYRHYVGGGGGGASAGQPAQPVTDPRADAFYQQLLQRSQQGLALDRTNPNIRAQADAYAANQERARRNYVSDVAERQGPLANIQGERRIAAERVGHATGSFEAELLGRELTARRQEISEALTLMGGLLSRDQQTALQRELAQLDAAIAREGHGVTRRAQDIGLDQFLRTLAQRQYEFGEENDFRWAL